MTTEMKTQTLGGQVMQPPLPGQIDPQAAFDVWSTDYMTAYQGAQPIAISSGLTERVTGASERYHLPIPPSGVGEIVELEDGESHPAQKPQGYMVDGVHKTRGPKAILVGQKDLASDKIGNITANVKAMGNDAGMMPDYMSALALQNGLTQLSFDRKPVFAVDHPRDPINGKGGPHPNLFNETFDVPGLIKITNAVRSYRGEGNNPVVANPIFGIVVPTELQGELEVLVDLERIANGGSNYAYKRYKPIVLSRLTDPKAFYVVVLNGPVRPVRYSVLTPGYTAILGPESELFKDKRQMKFEYSETSDALIADWRVIAKSIIP